MTEKHFIEQNIEKWRELELLLENSSQDPERLHSLFVKVSSDLSYARTFYPNRSVRLYLNNLTQEVFDKLRKRKRKFGLKFLYDFFAHLLPQEVYKARKFFLISLAIFLLAVSIGAFSTAQNPDFLAVILGEDYVELTKRNINDGDPMKIYKDSQQMDMFFGITINNIRVSFMVFVLGILGSIGTVFILMYNGIMLGAFQYFFYTKGLFVTSFLTIWIHGTIEISAIIIAGAAGMVLGNGVLFPGTYQRTTALQISALSAIRILLGTLPLFILAGFLESFVTRYTGMPMILKILIIVGSLAFILFMWVWYPYQYHNREKSDHIDKDFLPASDDQPVVQRVNYRNFEDHFGLSVQDYKNHIASIFSKLIIPFWILFCLSLWVSISNLQYLELLNEDTTVVFGQGQIWNWLLTFIFLITLIGFSLFRYFEPTESFLQFFKRSLIPIMIVSILVLFPFYFFVKPLYCFLYFCVIQPHFLVNWLWKIEQSKGSIFQNLGEAYKVSWKNILNYLVDYFLSGLFFFLVYILLIEGLGTLALEIIMWHQLFDTSLELELFFEIVMSFICVSLVLPFFIYSIFNKYISLECRDKGLDLERRLSQFGLGSTILEKL